VVDAGGGGVRYSKRVGVVRGHIILVGGATEVMRTWVGVLVSRT